MSPDSRLGRIFYFCFPFGKPDRWRSGATYGFLIRFRKHFSRFHCLDLVSDLIEFRQTIGDRRYIIIADIMPFQCHCPFFSFVPTITPMVFFVISEFLAYDNS